MLGPREDSDDVSGSGDSGRQGVGRPAGSPGFHRRAYALLLSYDGGPFKGWQPHPTLPTVGGVLRAALRRAGVRATPFGASRTDAGVHARAQVASFSTRAQPDLTRLKAALAADLPSTVRVLAVREAVSSFHAHWSSSGKVYRYRISFSGQPAAWRLPTPRFPYSSLDPERLAQALDLLARAPDVSALAVDREHSRGARHLDRAAIVSADPAGFCLEFAAPGFGKYLVRHLLGAALGYAVGAYDERNLAAMLAREAPLPPRAEADGLTLFRVQYPAEIDPFPDADALAGQA